MINRIFGKTPRILLDNLCSNDPHKVLTVVGLVVHLAPHELLARGGVASCAPKFVVVGKHRFVIIAARGTSIVYPLYSQQRNGRIPIPRWSKMGSTGWRNDPTFLDLRQHWVVANQAIKEVAVMTDWDLDTVPESINAIERILKGSLLRTG